MKGRSTTFSLTYCPSKLRLLGGDLMSEEKKGKLKMTFEVEINEELMDVMKEGITKMHWKMPEMMKRGEEEKK
jgi:hypothetical protein